MSASCTDLSGILVIFNTYCLLYPLSYIVFSTKRGLASRVIDYQPTDRSSLFLCILIRVKYRLTCKGRLHDSCHCKIVSAFTVDVNLESGDMMQCNSTFVTRTVSMHRHYIANRIRGADMINRGLYLKIVIHSVALSTSFQV